MNVTAVVVLDLITVLSLGGVIAISPLIKKVTNNWFFWIGLCGLLFIYVVLCRFGGDWNNFAKTPPSDRVGEDYLVSKALLLDICPFTLVFLLISCIVDPTRRAAKIAAPFAIFGGLITILGGIGQEDINARLDARFIFLGDDLNQLYFMMHYLMIVIGGLVFVSTPRTHLSDWIYCNGYAAIYYSYVAIVMTQMKVYGNVSGLRSYDWTYGEYYGVADFLGLNEKNTIPWAPIFGFGMSYIFISLFIYLQSKLQNARKHPRYDFGWCANWTRDIKKRFLIGWYDLKPQHPIFLKKFFTVQKQTW